jgi:carboxymethylenebutenolidase
MTENLAARTISITGHGGDDIEAYLAVPDNGPGSRGSVVVIHHMPGYDSSTKEITRRFAANGYAALMPNLYHRDAPGASPDDAAATARANGGVPDDRLVGDVAGAVEVPARTSGIEREGRRYRLLLGRSPVLSRCLQPAAGCRGGLLRRLHREPAARGHSAAGRPDRRIVQGLVLPAARAVRRGGQAPHPAETAELSKVLGELSKPHEFHTYDGAGHAFFSVDRTAYRPEAAKDGWQKIWDFYGQHLAG